MNERHDLARDLNNDAMGDDRDYAPIGKRRDIEDDPTVIAAIREGRHADDIWLVECPVCGVPSYWNQGSHAGCRLCGKDLSNETDDAYTLADYWEYEPYPPDRK